ncbi:50S ribosomal protein L32 [bacterium]|jgi:large subunit ribosomal protein L32|nr:50S ribosomal protein L32 [bacterium]MBO7127678.1 50S ribosomal protein L32 [bacterium]MBP5591495.1 50S ribosomal protein L32 [bacterium]MBQ3368447.1 50S ribosomal protein L32 [bacterium]MBQ4439294.1 50S ribosomal protein L32 [bacterium]
MVPKRKHCSARSKKRRGGHLKSNPMTTIACPKCGEPMLPHRICPNCGNYKGKEIISVSEQ